MADAPQKPSVEDLAELSKKLGADRLVLVAVNREGFSYGAVGKPGADEKYAIDWVKRAAEPIAEGLAGIDTAG